uniref:Interleukin-4 receptor alpha N-terminal domain-containing protein n=1 Tax=Cyprinus carpio carpio TaxID=630221 RepID=A0A9J8AK14_CYPCA
MFSTFKCQIFLTLICIALCYEPTKEDLKCFNDYETEMKCSLSSERLQSCSGHKLNITHLVFDTFEKYTCIFERNHYSDNCECNITVEGFVATEIFNTTLLEGSNVLLYKTFMTSDFIKPKSPVLSVQKTENGNFNVTWDDQYEKNDLVAGIFFEGLRINLTYGIKGGHKNISKTVPNTVRSYEIVAKNLLPNTNYILTATMSTDYNDHSIPSDQSATVEFTTSSSPTEIAKIIIPSLCVGLIVIISIIFICILRMKTNWWDKVSKPKIDGNLGEEKGHILPPSVTKFSPIQAEIPTLDLQEDKKLILALSVDTYNEKSSHSVESAPVDYGQAGPDSTTNIALRVVDALDKLFESHPIPNNRSLFPPNNPVAMSTSYKSVNGISSSREHNRANRDSGNCSGSSVFSNKSYLESSTDDSVFLDTRDIQFNAPTNDTLESPYQDFSLLEKGNDPDVCVNLSNGVGADEKSIMKNLITSTNPLYPPLILDDGNVTPSDEGYQAFQGLTKSTEGQWSTNISIEQALNACGALKFPHSTGQDPTSVHQSSLHFSSVIPMDNSYQCV